MPGLTIPRGLPSQSVRRQSQCSWPGLRPCIIPGAGRHVRLGVQCAFTKTGSSSKDKVKKRRDERQKLEASPLKQLGASWADASGQLLYKYYNWRQDTSNDLQLVFLAFVGLILANAVLRALLVHASLPQDLVDFWEGMYEVIILSFGQEFPDVESGGILRQMFSVGVAGIGLSFLALVLALVEQVVLETIEQNVRQGSRVYEQGHVLVLGWCNSQRDLEVVWKILEQQCYAHRHAGGTVVVVLTQREKLEMESLFRRAIPDSQRFNTRFVFRQGNPLIVQDLDMVAAKDAHSVMIVSDQSRCPEEADAQSLRCAILLDELTFHEAHTRRRSKSTHAGRASPNAARKGHTTGRSATSSSTDRAPAPATFIPQVTWPIHGMNKNVKPSYTYAIDPSTVSVPSVTSLTSSASTTSTTGSVDPPGSASLDGAGRRKTPQAGGAESGTDASVSGVRVSTAVQSGNTVSTNTATTASNSATNTGAVASVGSASSSSNGFAGLEPVGAHGANGVGLTQGSGSSTNVTGISNGTVIDTSSTSVSGTSSGANGGVGKASVSAGMAQGTTGQKGWYIRFMPLGPPAPQGTDGGSGGDAAAQQPAGAATPAAAVFGQAGEGAVSDGEMSDGGFSSFCANVVCVIDWDENNDEDPSPSSSRPRYQLTLPPYMRPPAPGMRTPFHPDTHPHLSHTGPAHLSYDPTPVTPTATTTTAGNGKKNGQSTVRRPSIFAYLATHPKDYDLRFLRPVAEPQGDVCPELHTDAAAAAGVCLDVPKVCVADMMNDSDNSDLRPLSTPLSSMDPELPAASAWPARRAQVARSARVGGSVGLTTGTSSPSPTQPCATQQSTSQYAANNVVSGMALRSGDGGGGGDGRASPAATRRMSGSPALSRDGGSGSPGRRGSPTAERARGAASVANLSAERLARHVIVEMKTSNAVPLLRFSCSSRFIAVPTAHLNARRLAKMIREPIIASISQQMMDFKNPTNVYVQAFPELVGKRFGELHYFFDDAVVVGVYKGESDRVVLVPSLMYQVLPEDMIVMMRPTTPKAHEYRPREERVEVPLTNSNWSPRRAQSLQDQQSKSAPSGAAPTPMSTAAALSAQLNASTDSSTGRMYNGSDRSGSNSNSNREGLSMGEHLTHPELAAMMDREARAAARAVLMGDALSTDTDTGPPPTAWAQRGISALAHAQTDTNSNGVSVSGSGWDMEDTYVGVGAGQGGGLDTPVDRAGSGGGGVWVPQHPYDDSLDPASFWRVKSSKALPGLGSLDTGDEEPTHTQHQSSLTSSQQSQQEGDMSDVSMGGSLQSGDELPMPSTLFTPTLHTALWAATDGYAAAEAAAAGRGAAASADPWLQRAASAPRDSARAGSGVTLNEVARSLTSQDASSLLDQQFDVSNKTSASSLGSFEASQTNPIFMVPMEWLVASDRPRRVLVCGWGEQSFMRALLRELDQGQARLPAGSEVVFANNHPTEASLGKATEMVKVKNISVTHVQVDPMQRYELSQLSLERFSAAIVLCDEKWIDPDEDSANGVDMLCQADMLRLDSMVMMVQLNLRKVLEDSERPTINIICQKVAMEGITRFEDRKRLPLGISVNFTSFAAKLLTQASYSPLFLSAFSQLGASGDFRVIDASQLAEVGERLNWWQLVTRALALRKILLGWYILPERVQQPMEVVFNPVGRRMRSKSRVWNKGTNTLKFVVIQRKHNGAFLSHDLDDDEEVEDALANSLVEMDNRQATWVQLCVAEANQDNKSSMESMDQIPGPHAGRVGRDDVESDTEGTVSWNDSIEEIEDQEKSEVVKAFSGTKKSPSVGGALSTRSR